MSNPFELLASLKEKPDGWDILVTDLTMPGMSGVDLILSAKEIRSDLPCILCSGYVEGIDESKVARAGANIVLQKPIGIKDMIQAVLRLLRANDDQRQEG